MARNDLFDVFFVTWVTVGVALAAFFHFSRNARLKRRVWPIAVIGTGTLFVAFVFALEKLNVEAMFFVVAVVALISFLNIRSAKFCESCGRTVVSSNPFSPARFCSKCGGPAR